MTDKITIERETLEREIAALEHSASAMLDTWREYERGSVQLSAAMERSAVFNACLADLRAALAAQPAELVAMLYDDGTWIAERTTAGRALNNRMLFAGSPKVGVYVAPPAQPADSITPSNKE